MALRVLPLSQSRREPGTLLTNSFVSPAFIWRRSSLPVQHRSDWKRFLYWAAATKSVRPVLLTGCSSFRKAIGLAEVGINMESSGVWRMTCESARDKFSDGSRPGKMEKRTNLSGWDVEESRPFDPEERL